MTSGLEPTRRLREWFSWSVPKGGYRPDIDGLRALAVIAVVAYHAFPGRLRGGFVGVDIFFVISGFLISTILVREMEAGTYRYATFLARRIRRIFPALCTVLIATFIAGWLLLSQQELVALGNEIFAGSFFFANILYWSQLGYFDGAAEMKPLLHLWSLGVEEQYYIFYPPILWLIYRLRRRPHAVLGMLLAASLACALLTTRSQPGFAFFMLPSRFWELLCGALVALWMLRERPFALPERHIPRLRNAASVAGVALMIAAMYLTRENTFPGYWALLPTVGAALFILAGPAAFLNRFVFSFRPIVGIGLISYSLYLWHWPLISFEHILVGGRPAPEYLQTAVWLALGLSILTYVTVEKPLRRLSISQTYKLLAPAVAVTAALGAVTVGAEGFPDRVAPNLVINEGEIGGAVFIEYGMERFRPCEAPELRDSSLHYQGRILRCRQSRPGTDYDIVLLGDSHAEHLFYGLAALLPEKNIVSAINLGPPVPGSESRKKAYQYLLRTVPVEREVDLVLANAWTVNARAAVVAGIEASTVMFQQAGYRVFVTDDVPRFPFQPSLCKMSRRLTLLEPRCRERTPGMDRSRARIQAAVASITAATGAGVLRTFDLFRENGEYFMAKDGRLLYRDDNHLSINGSHYVAERLRETGQLEAFAEASGVKKAAAP